VRCSVLQCVAVGVMQCDAVCCSDSFGRSDAVRCSLLQCVAVCCSMLQCVAVCCSGIPLKHCTYGVATNSRLLTITGLCWRI